MSFNLGKVLGIKDFDVLRAEEAVEAISLNNDETKCSTSFPSTVQCSFSVIYAQLQKFRFNSSKLKANYEQAIDKSYQSPSRELKGVSQSLDRTLNVAVDTLETLKSTSKILEQLEESLSSTPPLGRV